MTFDGLSFKSVLFPRGWIWFQTLLFYPICLSTLAPSTNSKSSPLIKHDLYFVKILLATPGFVFFDMNFRNNCITNSTGILTEIIVHLQINLRKTNNWFFQQVQFFQAMHLSMQTCVSPDSSDFKRIFIITTNL